MSANCSDFVADHVEVHSMPPSGTCESMTPLCKWCSKPFDPRRGGKAQRFCHPKCRAAYHSAARLHTIRELESGRVLLSALRRTASSNVHVPADHKGRIEGTEAAEETASVYGGPRNRSVGTLVARDIVQTEPWFGPSATGSAIAALLKRANGEM